METALPADMLGGELHLETFLGGMETGLRDGEQDLNPRPLKPSLVEWKLSILTDWTVSGSLPP